MSKGWGVASHATFFGLSYDLTDAIRLGITAVMERVQYHTGGTTKGHSGYRCTRRNEPREPFETEGFGLGVRASYYIPEAGAPESAAWPWQRVQAASLELL